MFEYVIAIMNMILHGIDAPNVIHTNTLTENLADIQDKDRFDVVLANPPFGGKERKEVQQNSPIRTGETAFLFLQHFIKMLKAGGRAASSSKTRSYRTPTTPRPACASCCWKAAPCTQCSTVPAGCSRGRA
jgi:type I restriction-modification system DNA methylase subunit